MVALLSARSLASAFIRLKLVHPFVRSVTKVVSRAKREETEYSGANAVLLADLPEKASSRPKPASRPGESVHATKEMKACIKSRDYRRAWDIFEGTRQHDLVLYCCALDVCAKAMWYERGSRLWEQMPRDLKKNVVAYTSRIDLCGRCKRIDEAELLFDEMTAVGVQPSVVTHVVLINAYSVAANVERALSAFDSIRHTLLPTLTHETQGMVYTSIMSACARVGDYTKTRELFLDMIAAKVPPRQMHYNALMTACAKSEHADIAEQIFHGMREQGLVPRVEDYTILLSCCKRDFSRCKKVIADMHSAGLQPNAITYSAMLEVHVIASDDKGAKAIVREAEARNLLNRDLPKNRRYLEDLALLPA